MSFNWLVVPALLALCAVSGRGSPAPPVESVEAAANRTLCPYTIETDEDLERDPQRIKVIKCLSPDKTHASVHHHRERGHAHSCSDVRAASQRAQCVELHDMVRVSYGGRASRRHTLHNVPVGCVCMFLEHGSAQEPQDVWP